jgi:hypothetical protein
VLLDSLLITASVMDTHDEYRRRAEDCLRLMRLMSSEADRRMMRAAARRWHALAAQHAGDGPCRSELSNQLQDTQRTGE